MRFAYADPPYLGMCKRYYHEHHGGGCWDDIETHRALIERMGEYDGWALSLTSGNLRTILPMCPESVRVAAWVKPFGVFKVNVNPAYVWEPVIFRPAHVSLGRGIPTVRDWLAESITLKRGIVGAKPERFALWLFDLLGVQPGDEFHDLFPGSGAVTAAYERWQAQQPLGLSA